MTYHIAVCDDEQTEITYLTAIVSEWAKRSGSIAALSAFESAEAFLFQYAEKKEVDILLLDIEMSGMNGVELAKKIRMDNETVQIVFITGFADFIADGYEVSALHYLMKPVQKEKLFEVLDKAAKNLGKKEPSVVINVGSEAVRIQEHSIICVEAFAHTSAIRTPEGTFEVNVSISELEKIFTEQFGQHFERCHRSYLVGLRYIRSISRTGVILDNGERLPLARSKYQNVNQAFIRYFRGELL